MFCPQCKSLLKPQVRDNKKILGCSCGYVKEGRQQMNVGLRKEVNAVEVVEKDEPSTKTKVNEECPHCGHTEAYHWTQQVGPSDEPEDNLYRCVKCNKGWRERY